MGEHKRILFSLSMSADEYYAYYTGQIRSVVAHTLDGKTIRFPASILRKLITHKGIHGIFEMEIDNNNKFVGVTRIDQEKSSNDIWL